MPVTDLYFVQFRTVEPGDLITVWRGNWCIGSISAERNGNFHWRLSVGPYSLMGIDGSYPGAQQQLLDAFQDFCLECCIILNGPSPRPTGAVDYAKSILQHVTMYDRSKDARDFMNSHQTNRMLRELEPETRGDLSRKVRVFINSLITKEEANGEGSEGETAYSDHE